MKKQNKRKLELKKETVAKVMSMRELRAVVGGVEEPAESGGKSGCSGNDYSSNPIGVG